jgi:hypothetical protein
MVIGMLKLAPTAFRKMTAGRLLVVIPKGERSIIKDRVPRNTERHMAPGWRDPIAARCDTNDWLVH